MKRIKSLFVFVLLLSSLISYGQSLSYREENDKVLSLGTQVIGYNYIAEGLRYVKNKTTGEELFTLVYNYGHDNRKFLIEKGSKLLIKTKEGSVIELTQILEKYQIKSDFKWIRTDKARDFRYFLMVEYNISKSDIEKLLAEGITKMRFETSIGIKDILFKNNELGEILEKDWEVVYGKTDFEKDF